MGYPKQILDRVKIRLNEVASDEKDCWIWPLSKTKSGYGQLMFYNGGNRILAYAHRAAYEIEHGDPGDKYVCHKCDNPGCFNPSHLFLGSPKDNSEDMVKKGRSNKGKRFPQGEKHWASKNPDRVRGENNKCSKLTDMAVIEIRNSKETHAALGRKFGVSATNIAYVRKFKIWRHI